MLYMTYLGIFTDLDHGQPSTDPTPLSQHISEQHLPTLSQTLRVHASKWREIGKYLKFRPGELDNIASGPHLQPTAPMSWLDAMLQKWVEWAPNDSRGSTSFANLEDLKAALRDAGLGTTAHGLKLD